MCCNCIYHKHLEEEWICDNPESENYGFETGYTDKCADYEEKGE